MFKWKPLVTASLPMLFAAGMLTNQATAAGSGTSASSAPDTSTSAKTYQGVYKVINNGGPGCAPAPSEEARKLYDKYGAWHFCFTYKFQKKADFFSDVTNIVWDGINFAVPPTKFVELYQPTASSIRFKVPDGKNYRLYKYWTHHISNVPPPGKYTDHKFINIKEREIDYWWKLKQRGTGKNARIAGVAEVVFLPDELYEQAKKDGFLQ